MDGDLARLEEAVAGGDTVTATVQAGPARVWNRLIGVDAEREIGLEVLVRHVAEIGPQRMPVRTVAEGPARHAAEADLVELEPLAVLVVARIHKVRAVREPGGVEVVGRALAQ